jgi:hypothetical protein
MITDPVDDAICAAVTRFSRNLELRLLENADRKGVSWRTLTVNDLILKYLEEHDYLMKSFRNSKNRTLPEMQRDILDVAALCLMLHEFFQ